MDLNEAKIMAQEMLAEFWLDSVGWKVGWTNEKRTNGRCDYRTKTILLSRPITQLRDRDTVQLTILHEIAHALTPGHGHDHVWRRKFIEIGGDGKRQRSGLDPVAEEQALAKYVVTCAVSGTVLGYAHRKGKRIANGRCRCHNVLAAWNDNQTIRANMNMS